MLGGFLKRLFEDGAQEPREVRLARARAAFEDMDFAAAYECLRREHRNGLDAEHLCMLGTTMLYRGQLRDAEKALCAALELQPDNLETQRMLAMKHLFAGDWIEGFRLYEGMRHKAMRATPDDKPDNNRDWLRFIDHVLGDIPPWRGEPLVGKRILVWSEHGRGDAIMNLRFLPLLRERLGAIEVAGMSDHVEKCIFEAAGASRFLELDLDDKPTSAHFDFQCSLFGLLHLLRVQVDALPGRVPYLSVPEDRRAIWRSRVRSGGNLKVGLVWGGNSLASFDKLRSLPLASFAPLFDLPGVDYFSLQKDGPRRDELDPRRFPMVDLMDGCADFMDTAALIQCLDLVVAVDSAVAHLTGAIGWPVWMLNRYESEWRWLRDRERSVWYPSMRIFNQTEPRNWTPVIERLASELRCVAMAGPDAGRLAVTRAGN